MYFLVFNFLTWQFLLEKNSEHQKENVNNNCQNFEIKNLKEKKVTPNE